MNELKHIHAVSKGHRKLIYWRIWLIYISWFTDLYDAASLNLYYEVLKSLIFVKLVKK